MPGIQRGRRLVHFSSIHALVQAPLDESRPLVTSRHSPPYDRSKAAGQREVRAGIERGLDAVILNPTAIIGPYDFQPSHIGEMLLALTQGKLPVLVSLVYPGRGSFRCLALFRRPLRSPCPQRMGASIE